MPKTFSSFMSGTKNLIIMERSWNKVILFFLSCFPHSNIFWYLVKKIPGLNQLSLKCINIIVYYWKELKQCKFVLFSTYKLHINTFLGIDTWAVRKTKIRFLLLVVHSGTDLSNLSLSHVEEIPAPSFIFIEAVTYCGK